MSWQAGCSKVPGDLQQSDEILLAQRTSQETNKIRSRQTIQCCKRRCFQVISKRGVQSDIIDILTGFT